MDGPLADIWKGTECSRINLEQREGNTNEFKDEGDDPLQFSG